MLVILIYQLYEIVTAGKIVMHSGKNLIANRFSCLFDIIPELF